MRDANALGEPDTGGGDAVAAAPLEGEEVLGFSDGITTILTATGELQLVQTGPKSTKNPRKLPPKTFLCEFLTGKVCEPNPPTAGDFSWSFNKPNAVVVLKNKASRSVTTLESIIKVNG